MGFWSILTCMHDTDIPTRTRLILRLLLLCAALCVAVPAFAQAYHLVSSWPASGHAISASSDAVFVVSSKTTKFTLQGSVIGHWAITGTDVSVAPSGNVYLADDTSIRWYDADGTALGQLPSTVVDPRLAVTRDMIALAAKDPDDPASGLLVTLDTTGTEFSRSSHSDTDWRGIVWRGGSPCAISYYRGSHYPIVTLSCIAASGVPLLPTCGRDEDPHEPAYSEPHGIAVGASGEFFVADACDSSVHKYASDGTPGTKWSIGAVPVDLTLDPAGNIYVLTDFDVRKFVPGSDTPTVQATWGQLKAKWSGRAR